MLKEMELKNALKEYADGKNVMAVIPVKGKNERYRMIPVGQLLAGVRFLAEMPETESEEKISGDVKELPPLTLVKTYEKLSNLHKYKGFLYIKCPECGAIKGFCSKKESEGYHCMSCGADIPFTEELIDLSVDCECGNHAWYKTNMADRTFDISCINCGSPVAVKYNAKKNRYETIND